MTELDNNSHLDLFHLPPPRQRYQRDAVVTTGSFSLGVGELGQKTDSSASLRSQQALAFTKEPIDAIPLLLNNSKPSQYGDDRKSYRQTRNKQNHPPSHRTSFHSGTRRHFVSRWRKLAGRRFRPLLFEPLGSASGDPAKPAGGSWPPPAPTCGESLKS